MLLLPLQELHEALILGRVESTVILYTFEQALMRVDLKTLILNASSLRFYIPKLRRSSCLKI